MVVYTLCYFGASHGILGSALMGNIVQYENLLELSSLGGVSPEMLLPPPDKY